MVERVNFDMIENYGIVDLDGQESSPFTSIPLGLVENLYGLVAIKFSNLGALYLPSRIIDLLENTKPGLGGEIQPDALMSF